MCSKNLKKFSKIDLNVLIQKTFFWVSKGGNNKVTAQNIKNFESFFLN